ncbi:hypothetical protein E2562_035606, partial [Oryza meyeriana var. granulata]
AAQKGIVGINIYSMWFYPLTDSAEDIVATERVKDYNVWMRFGLIFKNEKQQQMTAQKANYTGAIRASYLVLNKLLAMSTTAQLPRLPRRSARWYSDFLKNNAVIEVEDGFVPAASHAQL